MSVIFHSDVRTSRMNAVLAGIDADAAAGYVQIGTAGMAAVLVTFPLPQPAGVVAGDVLTLDAAPDISAVATGAGIAAAARISDGAGRAIVTGLTVGVGSGDLQIDNTSIAVGQTVILLNGTLTHNTAG